MNNNQSALLEWIAAGLKINLVREYFGDSRYLLNNMIAKFSLSSDAYLLSVEAQKKMLSEGVDFKLTHKRSSFYGKKSPFIYEHAVPASIVRDVLLAASPDHRTVMQILVQAGPVVVLLREQDDVLKNKGFRSKMPNGWRWGDDVLSRYRAAGIEISSSKIKMEGKIYR